MSAAFKAGRSAATDYPIFNLEQVEVLRGPQGTLFGKDALTGVINITTVKPKLDDEMKANISAGSRALIEGSATVNTEVSNDLAVRVSISGKGQRGYYHNIFNGTYLGGGTTFAGRGQLRWQPGNSTTVDLSIDGVRDDSATLLGGTPLTGAGIPFTDGKFRISYNQSPRKLRKIFGTGLNVEHHLSDYVLTSITGYRTSTSNLTGNDFDLSPQEQGHNDLFDKARAFSQEVRLASPGDRSVTYVIGASTTIRRHRATGTPSQARPFRSRSR